MFTKFKKSKLKTAKAVEVDEYEAAANYGGGVGGYGINLPKDKSNLVAGWWCPNCENIYAPSITECKECNRANDDLRKAEIKRKENTKMRRIDD